MDQNQKETVMLAEIESLRQAIQGLQGQLHTAPAVPAVPLERSFPQSSRSTSIASVQQTEEPTIPQPASDSNCEFLMQATSDGVYRWSLTEPLDTLLPVNEQIRLLYERVFITKCNSALACQYGATPADLEGTFFLQRVHPISNSLNHAMMCRYVENGYHCSGELTEEINLAGKTRYFLNRLTSRVENGFVYDGWGIQTDITDLRAVQEAIFSERETTAQERAAELAKANDALTHEMQERQRVEQVVSGQIEALSRSLDALAREPDLDRFLGNVLRVLIEQMEEQSGSIWLYAPDYEANLLHIEFYDGHLHLVPRAAPQDVKNQWDNEFLPILRSGQILLHTESDFSTRPAYLPYQSYFAERGIKTILNVPLFFGQEFFGIFAVRSQRIRDFSPRERELAQALAHQAMLALQITRLAEEARQAAAVREEGAALVERTRLAGEIHDGLAQGFTGIAVQLGVAERKMAMGDFAESRQHLREALDLAKEGLVEARRSVRALRPAALLQDTLPIALARLGERYDVGITCRVKVTIQGKPQPLSSLIEDNLLRIAQEALGNALQHADAQNSIIELLYMEEAVCLSVKDDGKGFDTAHDPLSGFGLQSMQERTVRIGGRFKIISAPGQGTEVRITVSVPNEPTNTDGETGK